MGLLNRIEELEKELLELKELAKEEQWFPQKYDDYWIRDKRFCGIDKIELSIDFLENCSEKFFSSDKLWLFFENKINTKLVEYIFNNLKKENE